MTVLSSTTPWITRANDERPPRDARAAIRGNLLLEHVEQDRTSVNPTSVSATRKIQG